MKEIRRLIHDLMNVLTSVNGFLDLAIGEAERSKRYDYMRKAVGELRRAMRLAKDLRTEMEAKATQYGEGLEHDS